MFCGKCGNRMPDDMRFCTRCGAELYKGEYNGSAPYGNANPNPPPASGLKMTMGGVKRNPYAQPLQQQPQQSYTPTYEPLVAPPSEGVRYDTAVPVSEPAAVVEPEAAQTPYTPEIPVGMPESAPVVSDPMPEATVQETVYAPEPVAEPEVAQTPYTPEIPVGMPESAPVVSDPIPEPVVQEMVYTPEPAEEPTIAGVPSFTEELLSDPEEKTVRSDPSVVVADEKTTIPEKMQHIDFAPSVYDEKTRIAQDFQVQNEPESISLPSEPAGSGVKPEPFVPYNAESTENISEIPVADGFDYKEEYPKPTDTVDDGEMYVKESFFKTKFFKILTSLGILAVSALFVIKLVMSFSDFGKITEDIWIPILMATVPVLISLLSITAMFRKPGYGNNAKKSTVAGPAIIILYVCALVILAEMVFKTALSPLAVSISECVSVYLEYLVLYIVFAAQAILTGAIDFIVNR